MVNGNIIIETRKRPTAYRESSIFASQHALCFNDSFQLIAVDIGHVELITNTKPDYKKKKNLK